MAELTAFLGGALDALRVERGPPELALRRRQARLRRLLEHAQARTELGAERLRGLSLDAMRPEAALARVAPIDKAELMARFDASVVRGGPSGATVEARIEAPDRAGALLDGRWMIATTSGTTGEVGRFVFGRDSWARLNGALIARILRHRLVPCEIARFSFGRRYRMAMVVATGGPYISHLVARRRPAGSGTLAEVRVFSIMEPSERLRARLEAFRPHYLHGYPSLVEALAHDRAEGRLDIDPEFISLGSEPVAPLARAAIRRGFPRAEVSETYGATEHVAIANQCRAGALHVNTDLCVLEPRDREGRPVPPGVRADHALLTNLLEHAQPIVRYRLADAITVLPESAPCPCGSAFPRIRVEGRSDDTLYLTDRSGRHHAFSPVPFEVLFLREPGVGRYQLVHARQNALEIRFVGRAGAEPSALRGRLESAFRAHLDASPVAGCVQVTAIPVPDIPREAAGHKLRQICSRVPRPDAPAARVG